MARFYALRLALVWGTLPLAVVAIVGCVAASATLTAAYGFDFWPAQLFIAAAVLFLFYRFLYGTRGATARVLSGGFPCAWLCCGGPAPRNEDELYNAIRKLVPKGKYWHPPSVVGAGWGWWTMRKTATSPRLFTHRLAGRPDPKDQPFCFWAGTSIYELTQTLIDDKNCHVVDPEIDERVKMTLWSHPSISNISLGGWLGPSAHGSRGDAGQGSSYAVRLKDGIEVWDMRAIASGSLEYKRFVGYQELRYLMDEDPNAANYLVVRVHFDPERLSPNRMIQTELVVVKDAVSATEYLKPGRILSVLFVGSGREHALGLRYTKVYDNNTKRPLITGCPCLPWKQQHIDPHDCSRDCRAAQLDTCSFIGGWYETSRDAWRGRATLRDANLFTPLYMPPIVGIGAALGFVYNFEIICRLPADKPVMTGDWFYKLISKFRERFRKTRGRCELRHGNLADGVLFIDIGTGPSGFAIPFEVLRELGITAVALHTSKYRGKELETKARLSGVRLVSPYTVYYGKKLLL